MARHGACSVDIDMLSWAPGRLRLRTAMSHRCPRRARHLLTPWLLLLLGAPACGETVIGEACELLPGDLAISELMTHPAGDRYEEEWFEIFNASSETRSVNRLTLVRLDFDATLGEFVEDDRHYLRDAGSLAAGAYLVLGNGNPALQPIDYSYDPQYRPGGIGESFGNMSDSSGGIALLCRDVVVDQVVYGAGTGAPAAEEGRSLSFDGAVGPDALLNDDGAWWCSGGDTYDESNNIGSPGASNIPCGLIRCRDNGVSRDGVPPAPGELVVSELLLDAAGSSDSQKYWIELYVAGARPVDLNGLRITSQGGADPADVAAILAADGSTSCVRALPGQYIVIGASADRTANGDLLVDGIARGMAFSTDMKDQGGTLLVERFDVESGVWLTIDFAATPPRTSPAFGGRTFALDGPAVASSQVATLNDNPAAFCYAPDSATGYFDGIGTPGFPNAPCGSVVCCEAPPCILPSDYRPVRPPGVGQLVLSEIYADALGTDINKEWLEIYVAQGPADLNGMAIVNFDSTNPGTTRRAPLLAPAENACLPVAAGSYVVVSVQNDVAYQTGTVAGTGGITPDFIALTSLQSGFLYDVDSTQASAPLLTVTLDLGGVVLDSAAVEGPPSGASAMLRPQAMDSQSNDDPTLWCVPEVGGYFEGAGTPGLANVCGPVCRLGGVPQEAVAPAVGDLIITEFMADPTGADNKNDWLELYSAASAPWHLNTLSLWSIGSSTRELWLTDDTCQLVSPGDYVVLGGINAAPTLNAVIDGSASVSLFHETPTRIEVRVGSEVIDATPEIAPLDPSPGNSWSFSAALLTAPTPELANNDALNWCLQANPTPGVGNGDCP